MKLTLNWLKDHLATTASLQEITEALTNIGHEVDGVVDRAEGLGDFTVAKIVKTMPHPNADRLKVCVVETASGNRQIVCGAPNAREGLMVALALPGHVIPSTGKKLTEGKIRDVVSEGMLCSARELGLGAEDAGIMELPSDAVIGQKLVELLGLDDPLIDLDLTPNRADCFGVRGLARDLAAAGLGTLRPEEPLSLPTAAPCPIAVQLDFPVEAADACPLFTARLIRGVRNGASPDWLQQRLLAVGINPHSVLVDITNYLNLDRCRPLHVFDADRLAGQQLTLRLAEEGESFRGLNEKDYRLKAGMTVICDDSGVISLAGVMGGEGSSCSATTTNLLLESAWFDPVRIAKAGRALDIRSDARQRFERGVDPDSTLTGLDLATQMILTLAGDDQTTVSEAVVAGKLDFQTPRQIDFDYGLVSRLGGLELSSEQISQHLTAIGCSLTAAKNGMTTVTVPSWRHDLSIPEDLVEEVLRLVGYGQVPAALPPVPVMKMAKRQPDWLGRAETARRLLASRGLVETMSFSFVDAAVAERFLPVGKALNDDLRLTNPIAHDLNCMRPNVLIGLLQAAGRNQSYGVTDGGWFEVAPIYHATSPKPDGSPIQEMQLAGLRMGQTHQRHWASKPRPVDFYDAKGDLLAVAAELGLKPSALKLQPLSDHPAYHPGQAAAFYLSPHKPPVAVAGVLHPRLLQLLDLPEPMVAFELFLDRLPPIAAAQDPRKSDYQINPLQPVVRDIALILPEGLAVGEVVKALEDQREPLVSTIEVFDVYRGAPLAAGEKSVAISLTLQPQGEALQDEQIQGIVTKLTDQACRQTGAKLRA
jgi:phenylalanyl-tRNA synthetase beta chain